MTLSFPGNPIPQARPRFDKRGRVYDSQKKEKNFVRILIKKQMADKRILKPHEQKIFVYSTFYCPVPNSWAEKRRESVYGKYKTTRPDLDNYQKFYMDCMNGLVYKDDAQVVQMFSKKIYSDKPRVEIKIRETR